MNQQQKPYNVILIGDNCIDEYQYGSVDRLSPEAPIPVFCPTLLESKPGMAGNVQQNLLALGLDCRYYHTDTSTKTRMIDSRSKQHLLRIDRDVVCKPINYASIDFTGASAVVISDYNKGSVTYELIEEIQSSVNIPVFIDTKKRDLSRFHKCIIKINEYEWRNRQSDGVSVIVTHGGSHVEYGSSRWSVPHVPVFDVCGAGDTFLSSLVWKYLNSASMNESIMFAIRAASVTVQHLGVYAPSLEEIL